MFSRGGYISVSHCKQLHQLLHGPLFLNFLDPSMNESAAILTYLNNIVTELQWCQKGHQFRKCCPQSPLQGIPVFWWYIQRGWQIRVQCTESCCQHLKCYNMGKISVSNNAEFSQLNKYLNKTNCRKTISSWVLMQNETVSQVNLTALATPVTKYYS